jgi:hypothetical protein
MSAGASQSASVHVSAQVVPALRLEVTPDSAPVGGSVSAAAIDFGTIGLGEAKSASQRLKVTCNAADGYTVSVFENIPLTAGSDTIPDVTGDNGSITESAAGPWASADVYGFGYTMTNIDGSASEFTSGYRQFANIGGGEAPQPIMAATTTSNGDVARITYKLNVIGSQPPGAYGNTITYIATVNY